jgi:hypothetical protein
VKGGSLLSSRVSLREIGGGTYSGCVALLTPGMSLNMSLS